MCMCLVHVHVHVHGHVHAHVELVALQSNYVGLQARLSPDFHLRRKLHLVGVTHVPKLLGGGFRGLLILLLIRVVPGATSAM